MSFVRYNTDGIILDGNEGRAYVCVYEFEKVSKDKGKMGIAGGGKTVQKFNWCSIFTTLINICFIKIFNIIK